MGVPLPLVLWAALGAGALFFFHAGATTPQVTVRVGPRLGRTCSAHAFGAVGDGVSSDTAALINKAIAACGTVLIPAGNFSTGTLAVPSDTVLELSRGAVLVGRPDTPAPAPHTPTPTPTTPH